MGSVFTFLNEALGRRGLSLGVNGLLVFAVLFSFIFFFKNNYKEYGRLSLTLIILVIGVSVSMGYKIPGERLHFLEYSILGYLMLKATTNTNSWQTPFFASFILVSIVGSGDETIQWFLPERSGETKDVFMNSFGGLLGVSISRLWNGKV